MSLVLALLGLMTAPLPAAIIGTNSAALPLTVQRIAALPESAQLAWQQYLKRSDQQGRADREFFQKEMRRHGLQKPTSPPPGRGTRGLALDRATDWYRSPEAQRIAEIVVSFQTPAGGWSKNLDLTKQPRQPGQLFAVGNGLRITGADDLDAPRDPGWNFVGTFDNGATTTQLRFLAKMITALDAEKARLYRESFRRGLGYIHAAQYPNGGWPQVWPLQGGYHDAVTFNDGAMTATLELLAWVSAGKDEFGFVPDVAREQAAASLQRGLECVLRTQGMEGGRRTIWCQQYDVLTLRPTSARNYEMPSLSSGESAGVMRFLMRLPSPDSNVVAAVRGAAEWFRRTEIRDMTYRRGGDDGSRLVSEPGSRPWWSRFYEFGSHRPIFGDRDKTIHDTLDEISLERRNGYAWYTDAPEGALKQFERWKQAQR